MPAGHLHPLTDPALHTPGTGRHDVTTGELGTLPSCSRPHMVDLRNGGDLPFTTVGRHRRANPDRVLRIAHHNLERLSATHPRGPAAHWVSQWRDVLNGHTERVIEVLTSPTPWAREMRQNSPFAGVLADEDRERVLFAFIDNERKLPTAANTPSAP